MHTVKRDSNIVKKGVIGCFMSKLNMYPAWQSVLLSISSSGHHLLPTQVIAPSTCRRAENWNTADLTF